MGHAAVRQQGGNNETAMVMVAARESSSGRRHGQRRWTMQGSDDDNGHHGAVAMETVEQLERRLTWETYLLCSRVIRWKLYLYTPHIGRVGGMDWEGRGDRLGDNRETKEEDLTTQ